MDITESPVAYDYKTIKLTQSRIDKGLLAIPVSLIDNFPTEMTKIQICFDDREHPVERNFTPYESSSRECRIGGMREFYKKNGAKDGDEIVIQFLGDNRYRILTEHRFNFLVSKFQSDFDGSKSEEDAEEKIELLARITNTNKNQVIGSEFLRIAKGAIEVRKYQKERPTRTKEGAPHSIRRLLAEIYRGRCQLTDFGFTMKNGQPYFEIHHINPNFGHQLKNLLVVCPNVHAQFDYAEVEEYFDEEGWLQRVRFNEQEYAVRQHINSLLKKEFSKELHILEDVH